MSKRAPAAELTNAELTAQTYPVCQAPASPQRGYWRGSATSRWQGWRDRALRAEELVAELRAELAGRWRLKP